MEKLSIISVEDPKGGFTGFLKDRPNIIAEGNTHVELVQNLMSLVNSVKEHENKLKK